MTYDFKDFEKLTTLSSNLTTFLESLMKCRLGPTISYNGNRGDTVVRTKELFQFESTFPNVLLHYTFRGSPIYILNARIYRVMHQIMNRLTIFMRALGFRQND
mgnify:CR=1 FL=1